MSGHIQGERHRLDRIKIVYVIGTLELGGAEHQLVALARGLDRSRYLSVVFCLTATGPLRAELEQAGIRVACFGLRGLRIWRSPLRVFRIFLAFLREMRKEKPAIVHGFLFHAYVLGACVAKLAGVPIVVSSRRSLGRFKAKRPHYLLAERLANRLTNVIVANSEAVRQDTICQEGVDPSRVRVVKNGIDASPYGLPSDPALRDSLGVSPSARVIGVVANLIHYKGHRFLLEAVQEIHRRGLDVRCLLVGDGPCRADLERLVKNLGLEKDVVFLGSRQDVPRLLALMDLVVLPSLEEGFPNAILEAMAAGKPVVATRVGGTPEAVVHEETGLLILPGDPRALADAILRLLEDPPLAEKMGKAGRARVVSMFSVDKMVTQMEAVYAEMAQRHCHTG